MIKNKKEGLTLLEVLIAIALLAVMAVAIIFSNPGERLAVARNAQRETHLQAIYAGVEQFAFRENAYPACLENPEEQVDFYQCQELVPGYVTQMLFDPTCGSEEEETTGYILIRSAGGRIGVYAECAEQEKNLVAGNYPFESLEEEEPTWTCGDVLIDERDDQEYSTVEMAGQCLMAENLNYEATESWCYDEDVESCNNYGRLYAQEELQTACPAGWSVLTDNDFKMIEEFLGMTEQEADGEGFRGSSEGAKLAGGAGFWAEGDLKESGDFAETGVDLLPTGYREGEVFSSEGAEGYYWTRTEEEGNPGHYWARYLNSDEEGVGRGSFDDNFAFGVRCIQ